MLRIYYKMVMKKWTPDEIIEKEAKDRTLRVKRFVSFKQKWANRKDVSYTRWQKQIVEYLQNLDDREIWDFISNFYFSKLALWDIWLVQEFRESLGIDEKELKYPLWIWKILYKKLLWEKIFLQKLQTEDFRFRVIDKIPFNVKRKIIEILNLIKA